jgi:cell division protein FtsW
LDGRQEGVDAMKWLATLWMVCVLALLSVGMVTLYGLSPWQDTMKYVSRQVVAAALGLVGAVALGATDYRRWRRWAWALFVVALGLLIAVLIFGAKVNGARRWFRLPGFQFQPSDFAKLALLVAMAHYAAGREKAMRTFWQGVAVPGVLAGLVLGLVFLEPDWGTALLLGAVTLVLLVVGGARVGYLAGPVFVVGAAVGVLLWLNPLRSDRVYSWLHLEETRQGVGYQAWQARLALGHGGPSGVGLNASTQKDFLPEHQTDFIFAIVAEELGYGGSVLVLSLFTTLFLSGVTMVRRVADPYGRLLGTGITFLFGLQGAINVAVVSGALPNKGLALPFVSYGGSNLAIMLMCSGLMVSIARYGMEVEETESGTELADLGQAQPA